MLFDSSGLTESKYSMQNYREWAGEIANSYFNAGALPTDTLTKIAQAVDLTPDQIQILATESNKLIHTHKYAAESEKYFAAEFPLADASVAIRTLQVDGGEVKVASQFEAPKFIDQGPDAYAMFGVKPEEFDKTASVRHQLKNASEKSGLLAQKISDRLMEVKTAAEDAQMSFIKTARQHALDESSSLGRMQVLGYFDHFVKQAGLPVSTGKKLLAKVAYVLGKEGKLEPRHAKIAMEYFMKEADCKAPEELISKDLPAQIVNGDHPLYITLKTIGNLEAERLSYVSEGDLIQDKARILNQKIRAL